MSEINRAGGVNGRRIRLTIFDDASNPSQGVVHMQRIAADSKYLGVIGSGFSSVGLAVAPIVAATRGSRTSAWRRLPLRSLRRSRTTS